MADERVQFFFLGVEKNKTNERGASEWVSFLQQAAKN